MNFDEYQNRASQTAIYPDRGNNLAYPVLGLNGEAGEVAEKLKKIIRDHGGLVSDDARQAMSKELGDVLWYVAACCHELSISMNDVASANIDKLFARKERGKIGGSGDDR
jgi:NTP pyrophosphatase (non-canonical NTP hydrolase)